MVDDVWKGASRKGFTLGKTTAPGHSVRFQKVPAFYD